MIRKEDGRGPLKYIGSEFPEPKLLLADTEPIYIEPDPPVLKVRNLKTGAVVINPYIFISEVEGWKHYNYNRLGVVKEVFPDGSFTIDDSIKVVEQRGVRIVYKSTLDSDMEWGEVL